MSVYVVMNNKYLGKKQLERYENDAWGNVSKKMDPEKYEYNLENLINQINVNDQILDENDDDMSAMAKWKKSGFIMPAPHKISQLKKSYENMTWKQFIAIVNELIKDDEPEAPLYNSIPKKTIIHKEPDPQYK